MVSVRTQLLFSCLVFTFLGSAQPGKSAVYSISAFGAIGDGNASNATVNRNAFFNALAYTGNTINVPAGTYVLDNSKILSIPYFSGTLNFDPNAEIVFTSASGANGVPDVNGGIYFFNSSGATFQNIHIVWTMPVGAIRDDLVYPALKFSNMTNMTLNGATIEGSKSAGIQFIYCTSPVVKNVHIVNTLADGLDFFNTQNASVTNLYTNNTGDDGLSFMRYGNTGGYDNWSGATVNNVEILNSYTRGIAVLAAQNITVNNFFISNTTDSGVIVQYDPAYNIPGQLPDLVTFSNGTITNAGMNAMTPPSVAIPNPARANRFGFEIDVEPAVSTSNPSRVTLQNIRIVSPYDRGLSGVMSANLPAGLVTANGVYVSGATNSYQILLINGNLTNLVSDSSSNYGFYFTNCGKITAQSFYSVNSSLTGPLNRAMWLDPGVASFSGSGLSVVDLKSVPTGYNVGGWAAGGTFTSVQYNIPSGTLGIDLWGGSTLTFPGAVRNTGIVVPTITGYANGTSSQPPSPIA